jgi:hypothetical protein
MSVSLDAVSLLPWSKRLRCYGLRLHHTLTLFLVRRGVSHGTSPEFGGGEIKIMIRMIDGGGKKLKHTKMHALGGIRILDPSIQLEF